MALFRQKNNLLTQNPQPVKRGRGRPRKIEQVQQGSESNTQIVQPATARMSKFSLFANKKRLYIGLAVLIAVIPTIYFYSQNKNAQDKLNDIQKKSQTTDTTQQTIDAVGKLVLLPADEQPTIASVSDPEKLKGQVFFANAQAGDKVLVYNKAGKAILYRPSLNKIVEMAPLNSPDQSSP